MRVPTFDALVLGFVQPSALCIAFALCPFPCQALGLVSLTYLVLFSLFTAVSPDLRPELQGSYVALFAQTPGTSQQGPSPSEPLAGVQSFWDRSIGELRQALEAAWRKALFAAYKQTRPGRLQGLMVEDLVQTALSLLFCAVTLTLQPVVAGLNVAVPLARLAFIAALHKPLLERVQVRMFEEFLAAKAAGHHSVAAEWLKEVESGPKDGIPFEARLSAWIKVFPQRSLEEWVEALGALGGIGDTGALALAEGLKANTSLWELSLSSNRIGDSGALALAEALKANTSLQGALPGLQQDQGQR